MEHAESTEDAASGLEEVEVLFTYKNGDVRKYVALLGEDIPGFEDGFTLEALHHDLMDGFTQQSHFMFPAIVGEYLVTVYVSAMDVRSVEVGS